MSWPERVQDPLFTAVVPRETRLGTSFAGKAEEELECPLLFLGMSR